MARMDYRRAIKRQPDQLESKYAGKTLDNGEYITAPPLDDLGRRADQAMRKWLRTLPPSVRKAVQA